MNSAAAIEDYLSELEKTTNAINNMDSPQLNNFAIQLFASVVAQTCTDYFNDARAIKYGNPNYKVSKKTFERKVEEYRDWFLNPNSDFNTVYRNIIEVASNKSVELLNGKAIVQRLDDMVADEETYPDNHYNFVTKVHP